MPSHLGLTEGTSLVVEDVDPESPAKKVEIQKDDVLTHCKDQAFVNSSQLGALIEESVKGEEIPIRYIWEGTHGPLSVWLSVRKRSLRIANNYSGIRSVREFLAERGESKNRAVSIITQDSEGSVKLFMKPESSWILIKDSKDQKVYEGKFNFATDGEVLPDEFGESLELIRRFEEKIAREELN